MPKDFLHVNRIGFLLGAFKTNPDQKNTERAEAVIEAYNRGADIEGLTMAQKNKIDAVLTIRDFEYVTYHSDLSLEDTKMNSDENYNSEEDSDFNSDVDLSDHSTEYSEDNDNLDPPAAEDRPLRSKPTHIVNPAVAVFVAGHNQQNAA
jgi:hypothetical protein